MMSRSCQYSDNRKRLEHSLLLNCVQACNPASGEHSLSQHHPVICQLLAADRFKFAQQAFNGQILLAGLVDI